MLPVKPQFDAALQIIKVLRASGHEAYLAGGCVRDLLLGREPEDYDVATSATPDIVLGMFPRTFAVGAQFGVVLVAAPDSADDSPDGACEEANIGKPIEVATFRSDGLYSDGRHPDEVRYTLSPEEDVQRRDFTINGLLLDASAGGRLFDRPLRLSAPQCRLRRRPCRSRGRHHSRHRPPERRFEEDHLRMLRAVRFAARFGFELEAETLRAMRSLGSAHPRSQPRARARRADKDAHRGPCAPRL